MCDVTHFHKYNSEINYFVYLFPVLMGHLNPNWRFLVILEHTDFNLSPDSWVRILR